MKKFKAAICQNRQTYDKERNILHVLDMIDEAASNNAELVILPEIFYYPYELPAMPMVQEENKETLSRLAEKARKLKIYLCTGSMAEVSKGKRYNRTYLINPSGKVILEYSKCHLFDVSFKTLHVSESAVFESGNKLAAVKTPLGTIGMLICYDIRFPEMARKLACGMGVEFLIVPAAFNTVTGPAHWDMVFRARAVENQIYVAAASPARKRNSTYKAYGHSMFIDPWGRVLGEANTTEKIIYAETNPKVLSDTRTRLPLLKHRRPEFYK
ncbi:MAG: hypothetical protein UT30_C0025G0005 [Candidatus Uhrbacteria bacterium GW2011_GWF2_39_13]|uniref:CN hydrolase domain-containing protein n=1 Tax=Candidatus Uhrbacteria bacterium GW2011_GWF2_39_13 TaxID=1618995 RepID=A0A0G0MKD9_9BACT|nr:MAG: hypothetical protein UT30_C0025G0005 [Candidatus Uhrbacteria bacterium GW2011_GWF2_39_13]